MLSRLTSKNLCRLSGAIILLITAFASLSLQVAETQPEPQALDLHADGAINQLDLLEVVVSLRNEDLVADVNADNAVNWKDLFLYAIVWRQRVQVIPRDPAEVAPLIDPTIPTDMATGTEFLYSGTSPIQIGVAPGTIEASRVAVLRGRVRIRSGTVESGVEVTVLGHPEFGRTFTREDGMFDLAVNGGGVLCLNLQKEGFLPVQRHVDVPWRDYVVVEDVCLTPLDPKMTRIDLSGAGGLQMAEGSEMTDSDGARTACILFPPGTQAMAEMPDGSTLPLTDLSVRATEFTVGPDGPQAMPAALPPNSAYTYCLEYSVDEAMAMGASTVNFDRPLIHYNENFLEIPTGIGVPTGYYDREEGVWKATDNGRVIMILAETGGLADLDLDGDDVADDRSALDSMGISDEERMQLASMYEPGQSLWRVPIPHFSPWDCNFPYGIADTAVTPNVSQPRPAKPPVDQTCALSGSIVDPLNQVLGEALPITGTPFSLHYISDRSSGRIPTLAIPISGDEIPGTVREMSVEISVAGHTFVEDFFSEPNRSFLFEWDRRDAYGRTIQGEVPITVSVCYEYQAVYLGAAFTSELAFGRFADADRTVLRTSRSTGFQLCQNWTGTIGSLDSFSTENLGGWTLDVHHIFDSVGRVLLKGDGSRISAEGRADIMTTLAGDGTRGFSGDGGLSQSATLDNPEGLAIAPDGSLYIADSGNNVVRRIDPAGIITTVAGGGTEPIPFPGSIPSTEVSLRFLHSLGFAPDGTLYVIANNQVLRIDPDGNLSLVRTFSTLAPRDVEVGPDGSVYISSTSSRGALISRVAPNGFEEVIAGGQEGYEGDGGPSTEALLDNVGQMAVAPDGSLYFIDQNQLIRRIGTDGIITTVVGQPYSGSVRTSPDGGPALEAFLADPSDIEFGPDGSLYILERISPGRVRRVSPDGIIQAFAGGGASLDWESALPALRARLTTPRGIAINPDGDLFVSETQGDRGPAHRVRRVEPVLPNRLEESTLIPAEDGSEIYVFDASGRHLRTLEPLIGGVLYSFDYDADGRLVAVADGDGNRTTIERDTEGIPTALISPFGHRTTLSVNDLGQLDSLTTPTSETTSFTYTDDGLMTSLTDPNENAYRFDYDEFGRLIRDEDPLGGFLQLDRTDSDQGFTVKTTTALGKESTYRVEKLTTGDVRRVTVDPSGATTEVVVRKDGSQTVAFPDGVTLTQEFGPDPRWGMQAPVDALTTIQNPGGDSISWSKDRDVVLSDPNQLVRPASEAESIFIGNRTFTRTFTLNTQTIVLETAEGRKQSARLDDRGRIVELVPAEGLDPYLISYDGLGRVADVSRGIESVSYEYDAMGRLQSQRNAAGHESEYSYDDSDRLTGVTLPGGQTYRFSYNLTCCNQTGAIMPNGATHEMDYTPYNRLTAYRPPLSGGLSNEYDLDRSRTQVQLSDGRIQQRLYDGGGRPIGIEYPEASVEFSYVDETQRVKKIIRNSTDETQTQSLRYIYEGNLPTQIRMEGDVGGIFQYQYDDDFRLSSLRVTGGPLVSIQRDNDGLVTRFGSFTITRDGPGGLPGQISDTAMETDYVFDGLGRLQSRRQNVGGQSVYGLDLTYDNVGRISHRSEAVDGVTRTYEYQYSPNEELLEVRRDGMIVETYSYDDNGNRTLDGTAIATYDEQDRLMSLSGGEYVIDGAGFLSESMGWTYTYSARGELLSASDGSEEIAYAYDGLGRRVARTGSEGTNQYLYAEPGNPFLVTASRAPNAEQSYYYYDDADVLFAFDRGALRYYVATDQVGSPRAVLDNTGQVVKQLEYTSYGVVLSDSNPGFDLPIGFGGGIADPATGLVRFGYRDYDPAAGRWTAWDPALFEGGQPNLYAYVGANPISHRDPTGLFCVGGSAYAIFGSGGSFCYDEDGDWSVCVEVGLGAGGGFDVSPFKEAAGQADKDYVKASAGGKCGPVAIGASLKLDDCGDFTFKPTCGVGPFDPCGGGVKGKVKDFGKTLKEVFGKSLKCKPEAKIVGGACIGSKIN